MPRSEPIFAISRSSASESNMAPLPWETRLTVIPSASAASNTAPSASGPSTLGISTRKWAPSGNRCGLGAGTGSGWAPSRSSTWALARSVGGCSCVIAHLLGLPRGPT